MVRGEKEIQLKGKMGEEEKGRKGIKQKEEEIRMRRINFEYNDKKVKVDSERAVDNLRRKYMFGGRNRKERKEKPEQGRKDIQV